MYKLSKSVITGELVSIIMTTDTLTISIPIDPNNVDYQEYQRWLEAGNVPEPADEIQTP